MGRRLLLFSVVLAVAVALFAPPRRPARRGIECAAVGEGCLPASSGGCRGDFIESHNLGEQVCFLAAGGVLYESGRDRCVCPAAAKTLPAPEHTDAGAVSIDGLEIEVAPR